MDNPMTVNLPTLQPGQSGTIAAIHVGEDLYHRLAALGFRVGKRLEIVRKGCCSGPLQVRIGTTDIIMRRHDAQQIDVKVPG